MIIEGNFNVGGRIFNRKLLISEWMYSAAAVGLIRFFRWNNWNDRYEIEEMNLYYNIEDIIPNKEITDAYEADKAYLAFAEYRFPMHHIELKRLMNKENLCDEDIKLINSKLSANVSMKSVFKGIRFNGNNKHEITNLIDNNRWYLIAETFKNLLSGYRKFLNYSRYRSESSDVSRIWGFYVDKTRKTNAMGFSMNKHSRNREDAVEFDYIPFAFSKGRESIFINNNYKIEYLISNNDMFEELLRKHAEDGNEWNRLLYNYVHGSTFLRHDVELIRIKSEAEAYETIILHKSAIDIFTAISDKCRRNGYEIDRILRRKVKVNENLYISISDELTYNLINGLKLDSLIERLLKIEYHNKQESSENSLIKGLIEFNEIIYRSKKGGNIMENRFAASRAAAKQVVGYFVSRDQTNKIRAYRQKLASTLVANDQSRFLDVMLQLSSYTEIAFPFMHEVIADFDGNRNLAYDFVNELMLSNNSNLKKTDETGIN